MTKSENLPEKKTLSDFFRVHTKGIIDPIVTLLAQIGVTPNMLTFMGFVIHIPIAWYLSQGQFRSAALLGILSMFDILDGALARKLNRANQSKFGAFLDSTTDRVAEIVMFSGLIYYFAQQGATDFMLLSYFMVGGCLMVSYTRSRAEALGYSCKIGIMSRFERYLTLFLFGMLNLPEYGVIALVIGTWFTVLQRSFHVLKQAKATH